MSDAGKARLFVGQDLSSIEDYANHVAAPSGVVSYTSIQRLEGLDSAQDDGGGTMYLSQLHGEFPEVPVTLGFYLVGALNAINQGTFDASLDHLATYLNGLGVTVLLRVGYEFDGPWNQYDPAAYTLAFQRVRTRISAQAQNVEYVWHAAASCGGTFDSNPIEAWYPGDDIVDWVGASYFTQSDCQFSPVKHLLNFARQHQKPFLVAESTPQGYDLCQQTFSRDGVHLTPEPASQIFDEWYAPYFDFVSQNSDVVRAVSYIDANWGVQRMWAAPYPNGYFGDSRVQCDADLLASWKSRISSGNFQ